MILLPKLRLGTYGYAEGVRYAIAKPRDMESLKEKHVSVAAVISDDSEQKCADLANATGVPSLIIQETAGSFSPGSLKYVLLNSTMPIEKAKDVMEDFVKKLSLTAKIFLDMEKVEDPASWLRTFGKDAPIIAVDRRLKPEKIIEILRTCGSKENLIISPPGNIKLWRALIKD